MTQHCPLSSLRYNIIERASSCSLPQAKAHGDSLWAPWFYLQSVFWQHACVFDIIVFTLSQLQKAQGLKVMWTPRETKSSMKSPRLVAQDWYKGKNHKGVNYTFPQVGEKLFRPLTQLATVQLPQNSIGKIQWDRIFLELKESQECSL